MTENDGKTEYWQVPPGSAVRAAPPIDVDADSIEDFNSTAAFGADEAICRTGESLYAVIGLDFGTSSTKVIVRFPYEAGKSAYVVNAPDFCLSEDNPHLWQTVVWRDKKGGFCPYPVGGAESLQTLKQDLMTDAQNSGKINIASTGSAAAAYVAFVLRYVKGWMIKKHPQIFNNRNPVWTLNVGMATKGYDDEVLRCAYRRVAAAAYILSFGNSDIAAASVVSALNDEKAVAAAHSKEAAEELGIAVFPETTAQAAGFIKASAGSKSGVFAMIDVGAMTLDVSTGFIHTAEAFENKWGWHR